MSSRSALILLLITTQTVLLINGSMDCESYRYMYTLQPPEAVTCSPYTRGILNLTCAVSGGEVEDIQWYFMPEDSSETILLTNNSQITIIQSEFEGHYSVIMTIGNLTDDDAGFYWCQGLIQHEDHTLELSMSDQFHLLTEDRYFPFLCPNKALKSSDVKCAAIVPRPIATTTMELPGYTTAIELLIPNDESTTIEPTTSLFHLPTTPLTTITKLSPTSKPTVIVTDPITDQPPSGSQTDTTTLSPPDQGTVQLSDIILYAILGLLGFLVVLVFSLSVVISVLCCKKRHRTIDGKEAPYDQFSTESEAPHGTMTLKSLDSYPLGPPPPPPYRLPIHPSHSDTMTSSSSGVYDEIHTVVSQYGTQTCMFPLYQEIQAVQVDNISDRNTPSVTNHHLTGEAQDSALGGESSDGDLSQDHSYDHPSPPISQPVLQDIVRHQHSITTQHGLSDHQQHGFHPPPEHAEQTDMRSSIEDSSDFTNSNLQVTPPPSEQNVITSTLTGSSSNSGGINVADLIAPRVEFVDADPFEEGDSSSSTPLPAIPEHPYHVLENGRFKQRDRVIQEGISSVEVAPLPQILHRLSFSEDEGYDRLVGPPHIYHILQKSPSLVQPRIRECSPTSGYHHLDNRIEHEAPLTKARMHDHASLPPRPLPPLTLLDDVLLSEESSTVSSNGLFDDPQYNVSPKRVINGHGLATKPHRNSHSGQVTTLERKKIDEKAINLSKYRGNYERDPTYMVHKLTEPITNEDSGHANACLRKGPMGSNKSASLPDITHTYQSLQTFTRDPLRNYEILKKRQLTSDSNSANV